MRAVCFCYFENSNVHRNLLGMERNIQVVYALIRRRWRWRLCLQLLLLSCWTWLSQHRSLNTWRDRRTLCDNDAIGGEHNSLVFVNAESRGSLMSQVAGVLRYMCCCCCCFCFVKLTQCTCILTFRLCPKQTWTVLIFLLLSWPKISSRFHRILYLLCDCHVSRDESQATRQHVITLETCILMNMQTSGNSISKLA